MLMRHGATLVGAVLLASTTAFAQTTTPDTTTAPKTTTARAQGESPAMPVTIVGCVQKEIDYRKEHNIKRGGRLNTGLGDGDEYILINAVRVSPGSAPAASADCSTPGSGEAFELTGGMEEKFKNLVGKRVEVSGTQKRAKLGADGRPEGGSDPMNGDLKLFEVEVAAMKEAVATTAQVERTETTVQTPPPATTAPPPAATAPPPAPEPAPAPAPAPAPTGTSGATTALPHTASPLPLFELSTLLAFGGAYGVRRLRMTLKK